jgi:type II secretory pathway component GspD/PulD (secretin)
MASTHVTRRFLFSRGSGLLLVALVAGTALLGPRVRPAAAARGEQPPPNAAAASELVEYLPRPSEAERAILAKLDESVTLQFVETPLSDVVTFLVELTKLNIVLDRVALEEEGVTGQTPVMLAVANIPMRSALCELLAQLNLQYIVENDVLKITSMLRAGSILVVRVYPVADLCDPAECIDELSKTIEATVNANSWQKIGGAGIVTPFRAASCLVVMQSFDSHQKIAGLLRSLREARKLKRG